MENLVYNRYFETGRNQAFKKKYPLRDFQGDIGCFVVTNPFSQEIYWQECSKITWPHNNVLRGKRNLKI